MGDKIQVLTNARES